MFVSSKDKKGQAGLITGLIFGIASLVVAVIIAFVVVQTLTGADLLDSGEVTSTVSNETSYLNATAYTIANEGATTHTYTATAVYCNTSTAYELIPTANYTLSSTTGVLTRAGAEAYTDCLTSYTYKTYTDQEYSSILLAGNFTEGIDNVSGKVPTVLLVAAIVLILGVLVLLVGAWQRMRLGGGGI